MNPSKPILILLSAGLWLTALHAEEYQYFRWDAKINGQAVRLILDTGYTVPVVIFRPAAEWLGLKLKSRVPAAQTDYPLPVWFTEVYTTDLPGWAYWRFGKTLHLRMPVAVLDLPAWLDTGLHMDGLVGWPLISRHLTQLDASKQQFRFLKRVPKEVAGWTKLGVRTITPHPGDMLFEVPNPDGSRTAISPGMLALELPTPEGGKGLIFVDTGGMGTRGEIVLCPQKWHEWRVAHPNQPTWLQVAFGGGIGLTVQEYGWAKELSVGPLEVTDVTVAEVSSALLNTLPKEYLATLGFAALKRLDLIIDGQHSLAYVRAKKTAARNPPSGPGWSTVFAPPDVRSRELVAHVIDGSPVAKAGIQNGDLLLRIDQREVAQWRAHPGEKWDVVPQGFVASTNSAAGTELELTLKRGDHVFGVTVTPRGIAIYWPPPETNSPPVSERAGPGAANGTGVKSKPGSR